ncbi:hypothetical protein [Streptomyces europaeiscabiei]|uniref:hypothetical protein n=1 Tax=Streptomyces europaeiscabiei TaxID=146819 RepID=UPI002E2532A3|nr:hypothetical protein OG858_26140 [Streptomyces europaeiscabiei]
MAMKPPSAASNAPWGSSPFGPVAELRGIVQDIRDAAEESCGVESVERDLDILKSNPGSRDAFEEVLVSVIDSLGDGAVELISFCMHELRWQAVKEAVTARIFDPRRNVSDLASKKPCWTPSPTHGEIVISTRDSIGRTDDAQL